ncbi:MAG: FHA domain-containing protein [Chloroflexi bacterium]|nr:MAG: FHA domain-containing protein [Chloroflexota bacterium]
MSQESIKPGDDYFQDHLIVTHPDGNEEKISLPADDGEILKVGRELDNDVVLVDPRASRYHAEVRRTGNVVQIKDLESANGVEVNGEKIQPNTWVILAPRQQAKLAETQLSWQKSKSSQSTVVMKVQRRDQAKASDVPPRAHHPQPAQQAAERSTPMLPLVLGVGVVIALLVLLAALFLVFRGGSDSGTETAGQPVTSETAGQTPSSRDQGSLNQQSTSVDPTPSAIPSGPQLAIPLVELSKLQVSPIIFGASPNTTEAYIFINVRVRNAGNIPFIFSISNFSLKDRKSGQTFVEAGANTSENYLKQLGAIDRFENLGLTPGGSVPGSLVFQLEIDTYDLELEFQAPDVAPVVVGLGTVNMRRELDLAAGTPLAAIDGVSPATPAPTLEPTPTATLPAAIPAPRVVPRSALKGTIAYAAFDGNTYNLYLGDVASRESRYFRQAASQPAFSPDGSRIAFHSWDNASRGLVTMDVTGANPRLVANFIEDQLPTWTGDGSDIIFLTRRTGDRKSNLRQVDSNTENDEGVILGEGEYPSVGANGKMVFKGWGTTAFGLRISNPDMSDVEIVTNAENDTAPSLSPDGSKIAFMSRREGSNWDIYTANTDGSNLRRLTQDNAQDGLPAWSPDGNAIAFVSDRGGVWAVWVMTPDGKGISQLFTMEGAADGFVGNDNYASRGWAEERISWTSQKLVE